MSKDDYPHIAKLETDVKNHGEVHAIIEEHDGDVDVRRGDYHVDYDQGLLFVTDGSTEHRICLDRIVRWYLPDSVF